MKVTNSNFMKAIFYRTIMMLIVFNFSACNDDDSGNNFGLSNCCENEFLFTEIDDYMIAAPNIITPNNDGTNDRFVIYSNVNDKTIASLKIFRGSNLVFEKEDFSVNEFPGVWEGEDDDGEFKSGQYQYEIVVNNQAGSALTFAGVLCVCNCQRVLGEPEEGKCFLDQVYSEKCIFGNQIQAGFAAQTASEDFKTLDPGEFGSCL